MKNEKEYGPSLVETKKYSLGMVENSKKRRPDMIEMIHLPLEIPILGMCLGNMIKKSEGQWWWEWRVLIPPGKGI